MAEKSPQKLKIQQIQNDYQNCQLNILPINSDDDDDDDEDEDEESVKSAKSSNVQLDANEQVQPSQNQNLLCTSDFQPMPSTSRINNEVCQTFSDHDSEDEEENIHCDHCKRFFSLNDYHEHLNDIYGKPSLPEEAYLADFLNQVLNVEPSAEGDEPNEEFEIIPEQYSLQQEGQGSKTKEKGVGKKSVPQNQAAQTNESDNENATETSTSEPPEDFFQQQEVYSNKSFAIVRQGIGFAYQRNFLYHDVHILLTTVMKSKDQILMKDSLNSIKSALLHVLQELSKRFKKTQEFYICLEHDSIQGNGLCSEVFRFDEDLNHDLDRFIQMLENLLSSRKSIEVDKSLKFKLKILADVPSEMRKAREKKNVVQRRWRKKYYANKRRITRGPRGKACYQDPFIWPVPICDEFDSYCVILSCIISIYQILAKERGGAYAKSWSKLSRFQWKKEEHESYEKATKELNTIFNKLKKEKSEILSNPYNYEEVIPILSAYYETNIFVLSSKIESFCEFNYPSIPKPHWPNAYLHLEKITEDTFHMNPIHSIDQFCKKYRFYCIYCKKTYSSSKLLHLNNS